MSLPERMVRGARLTTQGASFSVHSSDACLVELCLFEGDRETRLPMLRHGNWHQLEVRGATAGLRYGFRAHGDFAPEQGRWFDPSKLLVDPYAGAIDSRFSQHPSLAVHGQDTAPVVPRAIVTAPLPAMPPGAPKFRAGGLIYEINVRSFSMLHPKVAPELRGTVAALADPHVIAHLQTLNVSAVELMPIVAWIDERHLPPLGLRNAWGYNPVVPMALDPMLVPGGMAELRSTVAALHAAGIGVILDLVFNHSGESDTQGGTLSFRGLDNRYYYAHNSQGQLINDSGCGNTLNCSEPLVRDLILDTLRHFVEQAGVDGFRFDLAPIIARAPGFDGNAAIFSMIASDPLLHDRVMIAEPWDIGIDGYRLGQFPQNWLEWNDRFRDDVRRFWRGDGDAAAFATRLSGSSDIFGNERTRSVNFLAAHDGFTLADMVSYNQRHNEANGEANRDGHAHEISWNHGIEGPGALPAIRIGRALSQRALLRSLFASRGTIMLTAGDEFGRSQGGNNNGYAQDNESCWLDWSGRDHALEAYVIMLSRWRKASPEWSDPALRHDARWETVDARALTPQAWHDPATPGFALSLPGAKRQIIFDRHGLAPFARKPDAR